MPIATIFFSLFLFWFDFFWFVFLYSSATSKSPSNCVCFWVVFESLRLFWFSYPFYSSFRRSEAWRGWPNIWQTL